MYEGRAHVQQVSDTLAVFWRKEWSDLHTQCKQPIMELPGLEFFPVAGWFSFTRIGNLAVSATDSTHISRFITDFFLKLSHPPPHALNSLFPSFLVISVFVPVPLFQMLYSFGLTPTIHSHIISLLY